MGLTIYDKVKSVIDDYNDIAKEYCDEFENNDSYNVYIKKWLNTSKSGKILDVGCGCAKNCAYINKFKGFYCIGIDLSDNMLKEAKKRNPSCEVMKMDMTELKFRNESFDGIVSNCSMIHIPKELVDKTLNGFKRILKKNGRLLLILLEGTGEKMVEEPYRRGKKAYVYTKYYSVKEIINLLHKKGFSINDIDVRITQNDMDLGGRELIIYAQNKLISHREKDKELNYFLENT